MNKAKRSCRGSYVVSIFADIFYKSDLSKYLRISKMSGILEKIEYVWAFVFELFCLIMLFILLY